MPDFMTVQEVARYLRVTEKTVYRLLDHGVLPASKVGHQWRFDKANVDRWLRSTGSTQSNVLIVDDDENVREVLKEIVQELGHTVTTAASAEETTDMMRNGRYDLLFLDLKMPGVDGAELFRRVRSGNPDLPVIITTAYPESDLMTKALSFGHFVVLLKPFNKLDVVSVVSGYLN